MVNRGRSGGCLTCKERRVKCDEAKPECQSCRRLRLHCGGYKANPVKIRFKDQSHKFSEGSKNVDQSTDGRLALRPLDEPDTAIPFFLQHYAMMGRRLESARGFYELLVPVYSSQLQDSPLSLAISALASEVMSLWRHGRGFRGPQKTYTQALKCLRGTIQDSNELAKPATVLAVLSLQSYENIAAIYGLRPASRAHHDGAVSLLPFTDSDRFNGVTNAFVRKFIFHSEMSSAIRQKRPLQSPVRSLMGKSHMLMESDNLSFALDAIGASVADLQASHLQEAIKGNSRDWISEAKAIDEQLLAWARRVPEDWKPLRLTSGQDIDSSIPTYQSVCEVYPTCQIGTIWNLWRVQRLLLAKIILGPSNSVTIASNEDFIKYHHILQEMVDSVCYSVPFFLGNQAGSLSISSFTDPSVLLPSHDHLTSSNEKMFQKKFIRPQTPQEENRRHIIAQGPWHIMSPLSRLLTFFLEDNGHLMATFLEPGQYEWIRDQFLRVTTLLGIPLAVTGDQHTRIENLAKRIRKSSAFMSGS